MYKHVDASMNGFGVVDDNLSIGTQLDSICHEVVTLGMEASEDDMIASHEGESIE